MTAPAPAAISSNAATRAARRAPEVAGLATGTMRPVVPAAPARASRKAAAKSAAVAYRASGSFASARWKTPSTSYGRFLHRATIEGTGAFA